MNLETREGIFQILGLKENWNSNIDSFKCHSVLCVFCLSLSCSQALGPFFNLPLCLRMSNCDCTWEKPDEQRLLFQGSIIFCVYRWVGRMFSAVLRGGNSMNSVLPVYCSNVKIHNFQWCSLPLLMSQAHTCLQQEIEMPEFSLLSNPTHLSLHHNSSVFKK